jgi:hypothetical protein
MDKIGEVQARWCAPSSAQLRSSNCQWLWQVHACSHHSCQRSLAPVIKAQCSVHQCSLSVIFICQVCVCCSHCST